MTKYVNVNASTNQLTAATYDAAGNATSLTDMAGGAVNFTFDALGMVTTMKSAAGTAKQYYYVYTPHDERILTYQDLGGGVAKSTWSVRDLDKKVLREYQKLTGTLDFAEDFIWRSGQLLASVRPDTTLHYHLDHLGTSRVVTKQDGTEASRHAYYPFGQEATSIATTGRAEPLRFTGHERDFNGGTGSDNVDYLDYMHARYYSPVLGRFLSVDPVLDTSRSRHDPQTWNRFVYARNSPVTRFDPDGRKDMIYVVNGVDGRAFTKSHEAALNAAVAGTRFEGRVRVIGPLASNKTILSTLGKADGSDMVAVLAHSGRSMAGDGNMYSEKERMAARADKPIDIVSGSRVAAAVSDANPAGVCLIAGCSSDQMARAVGSKANVTTFGTTNHTNINEQGNAVVAILGAIATGKSPVAAAAAGTVQYRTVPSCGGATDCDSSRSATVEANPRN